MTSKEAKGAAEVRALQESQGAAQSSRKGGQAAKAENKEARQMIPEQWKNGFIGNHRNSDRPFLEQAAEETGYRIAIKEDAVDMYGKPILDDIAVYAEEKRDYCPFWNRFRELKSEAEGEPHVPDWEPDLVPIEGDDPEEVIGVEAEW